MTSASPESRSTEQNCINMTFKHSQTPIITSKYSISKQNHHLYFQYSYLTEHSDGNTKWVWIVAGMDYVCVGPTLTHITAKSTL